MFEDRFENNCIVNYKCDTSNEVYCYYYTESDNNGRCKYLDGDNNCCCTDANYEATIEMIKIVVHQLQMRIKAMDKNNEIARCKIHKQLTEGK